MKRTLALLTLVFAAACSKTPATCNSDADCAPGRCFVADGQGACADAAAAAEPVNGGGEDTSGATPPVAPPQGPVDTALHGSDARFGPARHIESAHFSLTGAIAPSSRPLTLTR